MTNGSVKWLVIITENSGKDLADYQVRVEITDPDFFKVCTDQKFVEFYDEDGTTLLSHYTEEFDPANNKAVFWVKVPSIPANSTKTIYLNVNTERTEDLSNPEAVFDEWDDFNYSTIDELKAVWTTYGEGNISVGDGHVVFSNTTNSHIRKQLDYVENIVVEAYGYDELLNDDADFLVGVCSADASVLVEGSFNLNLELVVARHDNLDSLFVWSEKVSLPSQSGRFYATLRLIKNGITYKAQCVLDTLYETPTHDDSVSVTHLFVGILSGSAGTVGVDWIRVRKYTEPEPSVTVAKAGATPTLDLKKMIANCLAGKKAQILSAMPKIRLYSGGTLIKEITATDKHVKVDEANKRYIAMFLFIDESSDEYTTDSQELVFPHPDGDYVAFTQSQSFSKAATEPLPLRWEIYLLYVVDELDGQIL